jgi:glycosyltransferase involved in cell wall biosynthesis
MSIKSVAYVYPYSFQYRAPFNERVREILAGQGIDYDVIYSSDPRLAHPKGDLVSLPWATDVKCSLWKFGPLQLRYQHAFREGLARDLVILQQENSLLVNYALQMSARIHGSRTAFFGHARNFQAANPNSAAERFKRFWIGKVDWWFAYTRRSAEIVAATGFPRERITVFNNAIDTTAMVAEVASLTVAEQRAKRAELFGGSRNVGVYVGALYPLKRIGFLLAAAERVREVVPDFHLLVIGGGEDAPLAEAAARKHDWVRYVGPRFGRDKTLLTSLGRALLMPGAAGLAVLDSFVYGVPMVTTDFALHGPEIDYLVDGENGIVVRDPENLDDYAAAVIRVMRDDGFRDRLRAGGRGALGSYSIEEMARRFAEGVVNALAA